MSLHFNGLPRTEFEGRVNRIKEALKKGRIDVLLVYSGPDDDNVCYVTNWRRGYFTHAALALVPQEGDPILLSPSKIFHHWEKNFCWFNDIRNSLDYAKDAKRILEDLQISRGRGERVGSLVCQLRFMRNSIKLLTEQNL